MKTQDILVLCLLVEAVLVLIGLILGYNVWIGIICYWAVLSMKNLLDYLDRRNQRDTRHRGENQ